MLMMPIRLQRAKLAGGDVELEMVPHPQHQDRAQDGNNNTGGVKGRAFPWTENQMCDHSADNGTDDSEYDRPKKRHVHVHSRLRYDARDQTNDKVPN